MGARCGLVPSLKNSAENKSFFHIRITYIIISCHDLLSPEKTNVNITTFQIDLLLTWIVRASPCPWLCILWGESGPGMCCQWWWHVCARAAYRWKKSAQCLMDRLFIAPLRHRCWWLPSRGFNQLGQASNHVWLRCIMISSHLCFARCTITFWRQDDKPRIGYCGGFHPTHTTVTVRLFDWQVGNLKILGTSKKNLVLHQRW